MNKIAVKKIEVNTNIHSEYNSSSDEDEEYNHIREEKEKLQTMSSKILVTMPNEVGSTNYTTYFGLLDTSASGSLVDKQIIGTNTRINSKDKWKNPFD